jgi:hypothetical protein
MRALTYLQAGVEKIGEHKYCLQEMLNSCMQEIRLNEDLLLKI